MFVTFTLNPIARFRARQRQIIVADQRALRCNGTEKILSEGSSKNESNDKKKCSLRPLDCLIFFQPGELSSVLLRINGEDWAVESCGGARW